VSQPAGLRRFAFFAAFSDDQLQRIVERAPRETHPAGAAIFGVGEHSARMYLILAGRVRIHRTTEDGEEVELDVLGPEQAFGELALLSSEPRMAAATALDDCEFLIVDRPLLLDLIGQAAPEAILHTFSVLSRQIRAANEQDFRKLLARRSLEAQMEIEKQRGLTQMVAGVAHEINTPLGIISTAVSIVERELEKLAPLAADRQTRSAVEDIGEATRLMKGNIDRASKLVQEFKKVSASQISDVKEPLNLPEAIQDTLDLAHLSFTRSKLSIHFTHHLPPESQTWEGYRGYLAQILLNLLSNVERYAYPAGQGGRAEVTLALEGPADYSLTVADFGKGIPESDLARVYEPFFTTGRAQGGTGLGLTIVHNLVTSALKGRIEVRSVVNQGTVVHLTFPRVVPD
jgi:signal transduction histidine kinase